MRQTWRWFGPADTISIEEVAQTGAEAVVTALHHVEPGSLWTKEEISARQDEVSFKRDGSPSGLKWEVVESLPVSEEIKKQTGNWRDHVETYKISLENLASQGLETVCYNFMPVLDWTRTDLRWRLSHGGTTMRFDLVDFAAFDIHLLEREGAAQDYSSDLISRAQKRSRELGREDRDKITSSIACGLPGAGKKLTLPEIRSHLEEYHDIDASRLRKHLFDFLEEVAPVAQRHGLRLCCHPDDPPFPLLGLPRIASTEADYLAILEAVDLPANGVALCTGSLGARSDNNLPAMIERLGDRVHFIHLRNVRKETEGVPNSFHEDDHLAGDIDMVILVQAILQQERKRRMQGRKDCDIPVRPDHGTDLLDDLKRHGQPGYPLIGRLKGLAELRGLITALSHSSVTDRVK